MKVNSWDIAVNNLYYITNSRSFGESTLVGYTICSWYLTILCICFGTWSTPQELAYIEYECGNPEVSQLEVTTLHFVLLEILQFRLSYESSPLYTSSLPSVSGVGVSIWCSAFYLLWWAKDFSHLKTTTQDLSYKRFDKKMAISALHCLFVLAVK